MKKKIFAILTALVMVFACCTAFADAQELGKVYSETGVYVVSCEVPDGYSWSKVPLVDPVKNGFEETDELLLELTPEDPAKPAIFIDVIAFDKYSGIAALNDMRYENAIEFRNEYFVYEGGAFAECVRNDGIIYLKAVDTESTGAVVGTVLNGCMVYISVEPTETCEKVTDYDIVATEELLDSLTLTRVIGGEIPMSPKSIKTVGDGEE